MDEFVDEILHELPTTHALLSVSFRLLLAGFWAQSRGYSASAAAGRPDYART